MKIVVDTLTHLEYTTKMIEAQIETAPDIFPSATLVENLSTRQTRVHWQNSKVGAKDSRTKNCVLCNCIISVETLCCINHKIYLRGRTITMHEELE